MHAVTESMIRLNKMLPYIEKEPKITKQVVEKYIAVYDALAGYMEKMTMELYIYKKVLEGTTIDYQFAKKTKPSDRVESLKTRAEFATLVEPLNITIRNSMAHKRYVFEPIVKSVRFVDNKNVVVLKYEELIERTRELVNLHGEN